MTKATATNEELSKLAADAVRAMRVILVNDEAYLDGGRVRDPRIAAALVRAMKHSQATTKYTEWV